MTMLLSQLFKSISHIYFCLYYLKHQAIFFTEFSPGEMGSLTTWQELRSQCFRGATQDPISLFAPQPYCAVVVLRRGVAVQYPLSVHSLFPLKTDFNNTWNLGPFSSF